MPTYSNFIIYDLETTGLNVANCEIIEMAILYGTDLKNPLRWSRLIKPKNRIPKHIERITGISNRMARAPESVEVSEAIKFIKSLVDKNTLFVSHNGARFDNPILKRHGVRIPKSWDTLLHMRSDIKGDTRIRWDKRQKLAEKYKTKQPVNLKSAIKWYGISGIERLHRAGPDAEATYKIFVKQLNRLKRPVFKQK